jgi:hypothetical protein
MTKKAGMTREIVRNDKKGESGMKKRDSVSSAE